MLKQKTTILLYTIRQLIENVLFKKEHQWIIWSTNECICVRLN